MSDEEYEQLVADKIEEKESGINRVGINQTNKREKTTNRSRQKRNM